MPIMRIFNKKFVIKYKELTNDFVLFLKQNFENHYKTYDESVIRDFCDALISAKNDALREGKESATYLTDDNLSLAILICCSPEPIHRRQRFDGFYCIYAIIRIYRKS